MFDVFTSSREGTQDGLGEAFDVGDAVDDRSELDAEASGEFVSEVRLVDVAGGLGVGVEVAGVEGGPASVVALGPCWERGRGRGGGGRRCGCGSDGRRRRRARVPWIVSMPLWPRRDVDGGVFEVADRRCDGSAVRGFDLRRRCRDCRRRGASETDLSALNVRSKAGIVRFADSISGSSVIGCRSGEHGGE